MQQESIKNKIRRIHAAIRNCRKCRLSLSRKHAVPGEGPVPAKIMFVGEAPGKEEDLQGLPFVGRSGKFLNLILELVKLPRNELFITSSVKCRPPENRTPRDDELKICKANWLDRQISLVNPGIIVLLGKVALKQVLSKKDNLLRLHGKIYRYDSRNYFVTFHPSAAMRFSKIKKQFITDLKKLKALLGKQNLSL